MIIIGSAKSPAEQHATSRRAKARIGRLPTGEAVRWADVTCAQVNRSAAEYGRTNDDAALQMAYHDALVLVGVFEALIERPATL